MEESTSVLETITQCHGLSRAAWNLVLRKLSKARKEGLRMTVGQIIELAFFLQGQGRRDEA